MTTFPTLSGLQRAHGSSIAQPIPLRRAHPPAVTTAKIRDTLNNLILKSPQNWQTSVGLPFFQIEGTVVEWDEVRFDVRLMQRVPYEGVSRMQTSLRRRHRDRVVRRGLALIIESDFVRSKRFDPLRALLCRAAPPISHPCVPLACAVRDRRRPSALCRSCAPRLKLHHCSIHQLTRCVVVRRAHPFGTASRRCAPAVAFRTRL